MTEKIKAKANTPADFVSMVPSMLGFQPQDSLVVVLFRDARSVGSFRLDLPSRHTDLDEYSAELVGVLSRVEGVNKLAFLVYTDTPHDDDLIGRLAEAVMPLQFLYEPNGFFYVASDGWGFWGDEPSPLSDLVIPDERVVQMPVRESQTAIDPVDPPDDQYVSAVWDVIVLATMSDIPDADIFDGSADLFTWWESVLSQTGTLSPSSTAQILLAFVRPSIRDTLLLATIDGEDVGRFATAAQHAYQEHGTPYPEHLAKRIIGAGPRPGFDRMRALRPHLERAILCAPVDDFMVGPLAILGWMSWAAGNASVAREYLYQSAQVDPNHGFTNILIDMIAHGHLPSWAFSPEA
jgi:hypothetical protein